MLSKMTTRRILGVLLALGLASGAATTSWAQSAADPNGEPPIGIEEKAGAKGPGLVGVLSIRLIGSTGLRADAADIVVRLRRGSALETFFAHLPGPLFFDTDVEKEEFQEALLSLTDLREPILGEFFSDDCGALGDGCPLVDLVLKQVDEFGLTDDGANQHVVMNVTLATSEPL